MEQFYYAKKRFQKKKKNILMCRSKISILVVMRSENTKKNSYTRNGVKKKKTARAKMENHYRRDTIAYAKNTKFTRCRIGT